MNKTIIKNDLNKLYSLAEKYYSRNSFEKYIICMELLSRIHYTLNDCYYDDFVENSVKKLAANFSIKAHNSAGNTVLFYDGFGLDRRGLAAIYLKAFVQKGYKIIYVTYKNRENEIPHLREILAKSAGNEVLLLSKRKRIESINQFLKLIENYAFSSAFFYTTPWDVVGTVAFSLMPQAIVRYQINLTDHAYWIGKNAFDYCVEFRDYGASISKKYRKLGNSQIIKLPFYPEYDETVPFEGFPFNAENRFIIFSGGALYKTLSSDGLYYDMVRKLLEIDEKIVFWYAGGGNDTELKKVVSEYPDRVFHTAERRDLFQVMRHCQLYLNTYPLVGGLMTQYAARAGIIPLTLVHDDCSTGLLIDAETVKNEYYNEDELLAEAKRLIADDKYRKERNKSLERQVISEEDFANELDSLIALHRTSFEVGFKNIDNEIFRKLYADFISENDYQSLFILKDSFAISFHFPCYFRKKLGRKIKSKMIINKREREREREREEELLVECKLIKAKCMAKISTLAKRNEYDFSVIVATYNPSLEKLRQTLHSVVCQKNVLFEIIVCDDGSKENYFDEVRKFFSMNNFCDYKLVENKVNQGTVKNEISGLQVAAGKYIKSISPGDFLYDENTLFNAYQVIKNSDARIFFGNAFYYSVEDGEIAIHNLRNPRNLKPYMEDDYKKIRKNYLLMQDYILGADLITERISTYAYMTKISDFVKYAEDCTYIYMIANGEKLVYMDMPLLWYEYGSGISTNGKSDWGRKLVQDNRNTFLFLKDMKLLSVFEFFLLYGKPNLVRRVLRKVFLFNDIIAYKKAVQRYSEKKIACDVSKILLILDA